MDVSERSPKKAGRASRARRSPSVKPLENLAGARSTPSAAPGARSPGCTCASAISAERHAQLRHPDARRAGFRQARRAHRGRCAAVDRIRLGGAPSAAGLWRGRAGGNHSRRAAEGNRDFGARRARGPALRSACRRPKRDRTRCSSSRQRVQCPAFARAGARRRTVRLDDAIHGIDAISRKPRKRSACATPPACFPTSPGAPIPTIAASSRYNLVANAAFIGVDHPGARLSGARGVLSPHRERGCRHAAFALAGQRAHSTARAFSARRCASPTSFRRRCPACCRARRWSASRAR